MKERMRGFWTLLNAKSRILLVRFSRSTSAALAALIFVFTASAGYAQSGTLGSTSSPVVNAFGRPMAGVDVAICQPLATTAAQVISNTAVLTMASNPVTAGFVAGMQIQVSGFSGADTYFNGGTFSNGTGITGGYAILSVTSTTITYALTHANAAASSNGTVLQQGSGTTGCAGLSPVYTDPGMTQPVAQPIVTDAYGNWNAFAQSGQLYYVQFYGSGVTTSMRWIMVNVSANAALKPQSSDAVLYVSPNGNDSNDGLSVGTAKLTLLGAYNGLASTGGTIYVSGSGVQCTPVAGQGLGIGGSGDTNFASFPMVIGNVQWIKAKSGVVNIQGISATHFSAASNTSWATSVSCGNTTTPTPGLWLSSIGSGMAISRLWIVSQYIRVGVDSSGVRTVAAQANNLTFDHNDFRSDCLTCGPVIDFGVGLNDVFTFNSFENNAINDGVGVNTNQAAAVYLSNNNVGGVFGLNYFDYNTMIGGGGIRLDTNAAVSVSLYVSHAFMQSEGMVGCQPLLEVLNAVSPTTVTFDMQGGYSDCAQNPPFVKTPLNLNPCAVTIRGLNQSGFVPALEGPMTVGDTDCGQGNPSGGISVFDGGIPASGVTPGAKNQRGMYYGIQHPQVDQVRRAFSPSFVRFTNIAPQLPSSWLNENGTSPTLTQFQGPGDPSGVTNAATLNCTGNAGTGGCDWKIFDSNINFGPSDYIYMGLWVQPASTAGFNVGAVGPFQQPLGLFFVNNTPGTRLVASGGQFATATIAGGTGGGQASVASYLQTDGNWQWIWALYKVTAPFGSAIETRMLTAFQTGFPSNVYAPMFVQIPASSVALVAAPTFSSASESGNNVTFTTTAAHKLSVGMPIVISSCSIAGYNGEFVITAAGSTTAFTVFNSTTGLGSPTGCVITPGNDSEAADWANNLAPYGDNCATGTLCGIRGITVPKVVASGTSALGNSAVGAGACATVVTSAATGVASTDRIEWAYASAPANADGLLTLSPYVASGNVDWKLCNPTASSQTPSGLVVNWEVLR